MEGRMRPTTESLWRALAALMIALALPIDQPYAKACALSAAPRRAQTLSKTEFDIIEGVFHDGLGTFAEVTLANELIEQARLSQPRFAVDRSAAKMRNAIARLPESHPSRA